MTGKQTRRRFIAGAGAVTTTVAGCIEWQSTAPDPPPDVVVFNNTDTDVTATVTVTPEDKDEPLVSETVTIPTKEAAEYADALPSSGTFSFSVNVQNGPESQATRSIASETDSFQAIIESETVRFRIR